MRATFTAITALEKAIGKSMVAIINQVLDGDLSVTNAAHIVYQGLLGNDDKRLTYQQVGEAIMEGGLKSVMVPVIEFVSNSLSGVTVGKPEGQEPQ